ncbi:hypothetical protein Tco_1384535 [Tanacetum coccineum]
MLNHKKNLGSGFSWRHWHSTEEDVYKRTKVKLSTMQAEKALSMIKGVLDYPEYKDVDMVTEVKGQNELLSCKPKWFRFTSAVLRGKDWEFPLPPFDKGWGSNKCGISGLHMTTECESLNVMASYVVASYARFLWDPDEEDEKEVSSMNISPPSFLHNQGSQHFPVAAT